MARFLWKWKFRVLLFALVQSLVFFVFSGNVWVGLAAGVASVPYCWFGTLPITETHELKAGVFAMVLMGLMDAVLIVMVTILPPYYSTLLAVFAFTFLLLVAWAWDF
jgi:hypothetical protein